MTQHWIVYNQSNSSSNSPWFVLITDHDWWDKKFNDIDEWFCRNCPNSRPETNDTIIRFDHQFQFSMWSSAWP